MCMPSLRYPVGFAYLLLAIALSLLFWPLLAGTHSLAFRDAAHFYTPLYDYVAIRQSERWLPLWNPNDLTGMPLLGETSTAVLYPLRLVIYQLASPSTALSWYVFTHLLLAGVAAHLLAAAANVSTLGRSIAILGYPLAGPVLFLSYNPPFLVSAAWLPILLAAYLKQVHSIEVRAVQRSIAMAALSTAMMISAGDPQTALHAWLLIGAYQTLQWLWQPTAWKRFASVGLRLMASAALAAGLVAPQIMASIDWTRHSDRVHFNVSESLPFNVKAYHWLEWFSPFVSGQIFPTHTRITQFLYPGERDWTTTLYGGTAVMLLALVGLKYRHSKSTWCWAILFAMGLLLAHPSCNQWLVDWVPGYHLFRYPAKWLPFASLGLVMLAAQHTDVWTQRNVRIKWAWFWYLMAAVLTGVIAIGVVLTLSSQSVESSRVWGPFKFEQARNMVCFSLAQTFVMIAALAWSWRYRSVTALLILLALDLGWTAAPQLLMVDNQGVSALEHTLQTSSRYQTPAAAPENSPRGVRTMVGEATPRIWRTTSSPRFRAMENYVSERVSYAGRWHLADDQKLFNAPVTIRPQQIDQFWDSVTALQKTLPPTKQTAAWLSIYRWLGVDREWIVAPQTVSMSDDEPAALMHVAKVKSLSQRSSLVQWASVWRPIEAQHWTQPLAMENRLQEVCSGLPIADQPWVEFVGGQTSSGMPINSPEHEAKSTEDAAATLPQCEMKILKSEPEHLSLHVHATQSGWLTVKTFQDGHWKATIRSRSADKESAETPLPLYRTDFLFMGAKVEEGDWQIDFTYRPWWLTPALALASVTWLLWFWLCLKKTNSGECRMSNDPEINPTTTGRLRDSSAPLPA